MSLPSTGRPMFPRPQRHLRVKFDHATVHSDRIFEGVATAQYLPSPYTRQHTCSQTVGSADPYQCPYCTNWNKTTQKVARYAPLAMRVCAVSTTTVTHLKPSLRNFGRVQMRSDRTRNQHPRCACARLLRRSGAPRCRKMLFVDRPRCARHS